MQQSREDYKDLMCTMETRFNYSTPSLENTSVSATLTPRTLKIQNSGYVRMYNDIVCCEYVRFYLEII